jgi:Flp pilus assembly protein TadG
MRRTRSRNRERGTQLVEFALVLPFLLFMGMFVTEGANLLRTHQVLNNGAREGARLAILENMKCADSACSTDPTIQNAVLYYLCANSVLNQNCGGSTTTTVTINQAVPVTDANGEIMWTSLVTVSRPYALPLMSSIPWFGVPASVTLTVSAQFRDFYGW